MRRTTAAALAALLLAGCGGLDDPDAFAVYFTNDLDAAVIVENCGVDCHQEVVDEFQLAPGESGQANYTTGARTSWRVLGGTKGCFNVYIPHYRPHVVFLTSEVEPCPVGRA